MNATLFSCYSLAGKGFVACSGANHALHPFMASKGGGPSRLHSARLVAAVAELGSEGVIGIRMRVRRLCGTVAPCRISKFHGVRFGSRCSRLPG